MRTFMLLVMLGLFNLCYGQNLYLNSDGFRTYKGEPYIVISIEGRTASQLYHNAIRYINKSYKNPKDVLKSEINGEYLKYDTHLSGFYSLYTPLGAMLIDADYTTELSFKDGRVKFEVTNYHVNFQGSRGTFHIYENGEVINGRLIVKSEFEDVINSQVKSLATFLNDTSATQDNW